MTISVMAKRAAGFKTSRDSIGKWEVIADGEVHQFADIVTASVAFHELGGRFCKVIADQEAPNGFRRITETPLPADIAKSVSARTPRKAELSPRCVPVWR